MADPSVSERRIRPIQDAIATGNWKSALQQCEKWQKKGEKSDKFYALKAYILVNQPDKSLQERGQTETLQLCHRTPAVIDLDAIHQLQETLKDLSLQDVEGPKLWERAVAVKSADKDLLMTWLNSSITDSNWLSAQKAAMALRKAFPKERQYDFWNILLCHLINQDSTVSEKERALFGMLAFRLISKAAEIVPTDQEQLLTSGKAISTPEELYLLVHIYLANGHASEAVDVLQGQTLGLESNIGKLDPQLGLSLLLEAFKVAERWEDAFSVCQNLLLKPENLSDDRIWDLLLQSQQKTALVKKEQLSEVFDNPQAEGAKPVRSAILAKLNYLQGCEDVVKESSKELLDTCLQYYQAYGSKVFSFQDLRKPLRELAEEDMIKFETTLKSEIETNPTNLTRLFQLKVEYAFRASKEKELLDVSRKSLELYNSSLSEDPVCPEAALLAAMALLRIAHMSGQQESILRVTLLIQTCRTRFPDYYQFSVILVQCYCQLGLLSQAMDVFIKLDVKNLQWETVGHMILTRISSLHPHQTGSKESALNPAGAIDAGMTMLENADQSFVRRIQEGLKYGSYSNIINSTQVRKETFQSINKQLFAVEDRRIERLLGVTNETVLENRPETLVDKRDFSFLPTYGDSDLEVHQYLRCGSLPKEFWVDTMAQIDHLVTYLKHDLAATATSPTSVTDKIYKNLKLSVERLQKSKSEQQEEMTPAEIIAYELYNNITRLVILNVDKSTSDTPDTGALIQAIETTISQLLEKVKDRTKTDVTSGPTTFGSAATITSTTKFMIPTWSYLHASYQQLDMLQGLSLFLAWVTKQSSSKSKAKSKQPVSSLPSKEQITGLQNQTKSLTTAIHESARSLKQEINKPGILSALVDLGLHRYSQDDDGDVAGMNEIIEKICHDEVALEELCGKIKESWEDALDGILGIKVKIY